MKRKSFLLTILGLLSTSRLKSAARPNGQCPVCYIQHEEIEPPVYLDYNYKPEKDTGYQAVVCTNCNVMFVMKPVKDK
jgi:hypothetical protein